MEMIRWTPASNLFSVRNHVNRLFEDFLFPVERGNGERSDWTWNPTVDVVEAEDAYVINAELPGVDKKDIHVDLKDHTLTITGERNSDAKTEGKNVYRRERLYGKFRRSFTVPADVDPEKITADYTDGVLTVRVAKPETRKPRQITVH
jgi:HSP20 family protein